MHWIYLSPHLDDAALSVGGLLWEQSQAGESVSIWTLFAGDPAPGALSPFAESLHTRWGVGREAIAARRAEDKRACQILGATPYHFSTPDCIYRTSEQTHLHLYASEESLFGEVHPDEQSLIRKISQMLQAEIPPDAQVVCPLALGGHVDHRLTRAAAQRLDSHLAYYADYPYLLENPAWDPGPYKSALHLVSEQGITAWQNAVAEHHSQFSTFWQTVDEMRHAIQAYAREMEGVKLWVNPELMF
jgi:LmbE family N-acetylglucosaminyl deacetylase